MIIAITNCKSMKQDYACPAKELYSKSYVFRAQKDFFESQYDTFYILSAKYGLINSNTIIEPYNESVMVEGQTHFKTTHTGEWSKEEQAKWVEKVKIQLNRLLNLEQIKEIHFHVTGTYWNPIKKYFEDHPKVVYVKQQMNPPTQQKQYIFALQKAQQGENLNNCISFLSTLVKGEEEKEKWFYHPNHKSVFGKTKDVKKLYDWVDMGGLHRVSMSRSKQHKGWVIRQDLIPYLYEVGGEGSGKWRMKKDHPNIELQRQISYKEL